jgi:hypothetical protein
MILIKLKDGTIYENDVNLGWNLRKDEIEECLQDTKYYNLAVRNDVSLTGIEWIRIYPEDVLEIVEIH